MDVASQPIPLGNSSGSANGRRSAIACRRCNQRKTRCTAGDGMPCKGCANAHVECVLIKSNRGRYKRKKNANSQSQDTRAVSAPSSEEAPPEPAPGHPGQLSVAHDDIAADEDEDTPETLYARIAQGVGQQQSQSAGTDNLVFLGEAFSLTYVVHDVLAPFLAPAPTYERKLHYHLASRSTRRPNKAPTAAPTSSQRDFLEKQELLFTLPLEVLQKLLDTFFTHFHPAFPILDPEQFTREAQNGQASLLVVNAVLLVAISICDTPTLRAAGFHDQRYFGRAIFYNQAHALYNADLEPDKLSALIGVFFMSFWWGGPDEVKDSFHWLGVATNLAQALGLHRSTRNSGMDGETSRRWKRIWWAIRTRDTLVSGSIGRPQHINGNDCDVEVLGESDVTGVIPGPQELRLYSCQMTRLNEICMDQYPTNANEAWTGSRIDHWTTVSKIITSRYSPVTVVALDKSRVELEEALIRFRAAIPEEIQYRGVSSNGTGLWAANLSLAINYATILLCRPERSITGEEKTEVWGNTSMAVAAANDVTRVTEDIISASLGRYSQIHTIPALFNALAMHIHSMCTSPAIEGSIAENRARMCMLGLECLSDAWPVGSWVYRLFVSIWKRLESRRGRSAARSSAHFSGSTFARQAPAATHNQPPEHNLPYYRSGDSDPPTVESIGAVNGNWHASATTAANNLFETTMDLGQGDSDHGLQHINSFQMQTLQHEMLMTHTIPDLFALDNSLDQRLDQGQFFDLLDIPQLQSYSGMS